MTETVDTSTSTEPEVHPEAPATPTPVTPAPTPDVFVKRPLDSEEWREYVYQDGYVYKIGTPQTLYLKKDEIGASHRVVDMSGITHYIAPGFRVIRWKTKPGFPDVAF